MLVASLPPNDDDDDDDNDDDDDDDLGEESGLRGILILILLALVTLNT